MIRAFDYGDGCVVIGNVRMPVEVAALLSELGCAFTGWTALGILLGSELLLPYHPRYLELSCPNLSKVIDSVRNYGLIVWVGKYFITVGWVYKPLRVPLGELRIFQEMPNVIGTRCGLGVANVDYAVNHIKAFREHVKDLRRKYFQKLLISRTMLK